MTVSTSTNKSGPYAGSGTTGPFTVTFPFLENSHLRVIKTSTNGLDADLALTTDYTVTGAGNPTGTVTLVSALLTGQKLTIVRNVPLTQETDYVAGDAFPAESHERALDKLTMVTQQLKERVDAALTLPETVVGVSTELPTPESNKVVSWNGDGTGLVNRDAADFAAVLTYANWVYDVFTGDGTTVNFVMQRNPGVLANMDVSIDGVVQQPVADFTVSGTTLTFTSAPGVGQKILARYGQAAEQVSSTFSTETQIATGGQTVFNLTSATYAPGSNNLAVYVNGLRFVPGVDFTETDSNTVTMTSGLTNGDEVLFVCGRTLNDAVGAEQVSYHPAGTGAVATNVQAKLRENRSATDYGIVSDGVTSQTSALVALLTSLGTQSYRGWISIPYNTKFDVETVYAAVPTGVILDDESSINWGQPPGYKNKFRIMYSGDLVNDDTQQIVASNHHPAIMLLNMGTAASTAASSRYGTLLHGVGKDYVGDPLLGWIYQFSKSTSGNLWRTMLRINTPYDVAIANPQPWAASTVYSAGAYSISDGGKVYKTTAGGTSGVTAPTGTGTGINDGGVLWNYVQASIGIDATRFDWLEDGKSGQYAPVGGIARHTVQAGTKSFHYEIDDTTGSITFRDVTRGLDIFSVSTVNGFQPGFAMSANRLAITGTGPDAPITGAGQVNNGSATNMSTMVPPAGRTRMIVSLRFNNSNTTVVHGTGTNNFTLRGGTNVTPAVGQFMTFEYDSTLSARWFEVSRSF